MIRQLGKAIFVGAGVASAIYLVHRLAPSPTAVALWWRRWPYDTAVEFGPIPALIFAHACLSKLEGKIGRLIIAGLACLGAGAGCGVYLWTYVIRPLRWDAWAHSIDGSPNWDYVRAQQPSPATFDGIYAAVGAASFDLLFGAIALWLALHKVSKSKVTAP